MEGQIATAGPDKSGYEVRAEDVSVMRGERLVLRNLSLTVGSGVAIVLTGPNGSGKTTLLRVLAGLIRPTAGRVSWRGGNPGNDVAEHGEHVAYVGHQDAVKLGLTVTENLKFAAAVSRRPIERALACLRLEPLADLPVRRLSAGQRRRLALSRLLLSNAPLWLLDEPTLALDAGSIDRFGTMLAEHRRTGGMIVAATHVPLPLTDTISFQLG
ncbi:MAG TPA: heme ABC exporter ATP-binding protein CcmA [Rhodopila sp.]|uniref:heme ABC exporter ATP-binding protein CcmA n=1 Tax=Rhodopila sp. TaxID=2480087 RepID=UPI002CA57FD1|nr:heme ABC exporter ATP-binding protein CcmA [Rhodopila sp.]HVY17010.1 heme ABC exporter ATP-binding protein CcmA [Rhodopila sp.]